MSDQVKMVLVVRNDLNMRKGKVAAQAAHAATAFLLEMIKEGNPFSQWEEEWLRTGTTKICVRVDSEEELLTVAEQAKKAGVEVHVVTDEGRTEFGGIPTKTCLALGPDLASKIDPISGHLKLL